MQVVTTWLFLTWRLSVSVLIGAWLLGIGHPVALANGSRPNLVVIVTDDQGVDAVEGASWPNDLNCHTPRLASLAARGTVFTNARVNAACSPTRSGIMTGRTSFRTGVTGVINQKPVIPERDFVSLQTHEQTLAETLRDAGYYTMLIDKWHLGWNEDAGLDPCSQGFDVYLDYHDYIWLDDPIEVGDEHISLTVDLAVDGIKNRPDKDKPYALFFWTIDPHKRYDFTGREELFWWKVHEDLLPSGEDYYDQDSNLNRYRAVVEALDTEIGRLLGELGIVGKKGYYIDGSNTVVIYLGDNGTPPEVAPDPVRSKHSPYEGGIRVPFVVFGENVGVGRAFDRLVTAIDLYDTICDIAEVGASDRGDLPREGLSFADDIGWSESSLPEHEYLMSNCRMPGTDVHRIAFTNGRYKIIVGGGEARLSPLSDDEFYDLENDPLESDNLLETSLDPIEEFRYHKMRDDLVDYWPSAVSEPTPLVVDVPADSFLMLTSNDQRGDSLLRIGHYEPGTGGAIEARSFIRFDIAAIPDLLPRGKTMGDVVDAQIIVAFESDGTSESETDTGSIRIRPVTKDWADERRSWSDMYWAYRYDYACGFLDLPSHIIYQPAGKLSGMPLPPGAPVSFGHSGDLLDVVNYWLGHPEHNFGIMLKADPLNSLSGDQTVMFRPQARLRLTLDTP